MLDSARVGWVSRWGVVFSHLVIDFLSDHISLSLTLSTCYLRGLYSCVTLFKMKKSFMNKTVVISF